MTAPRLPNVGAPPAVGGAPFPMLLPGGLDVGAASGLFVKKNALQINATDRIRLGAVPLNVGAIEIDAAAFSNPAFRVVNSTMQGVIETTSGELFVGTNSAHLMSLETNGTRRWQVLNDAVGTATLQAAQAVARVAGGATSLSARDNANANDNVLITDAGIVTLRNNINFGANAIFNPAGGALIWSARSVVLSDADGNIRVTNNASTTFGIFQLGGTTSSFPGWKRNAAAMDLRLADDSAYAALNTGKIALQAAPLVRAIQTITYSASMTPNAAAGDQWVITATNGTAFTINAPTSPSTGQEVSLMIRNASGGVLGAATFNAVFKTAGYAAPANGFSASAYFRYDGTNWVQQSLWTSVIPN